MALATAAAPPAKPAEANVADLYEQALRQLAAQERGGLVLMTKAANEGYAPAEFHLGKLYENGEAGLTKDPGGRYASGSALPCRVHGVGARL